MARTDKTKPYRLRSLEDGFVSTNADRVMLNPKDLRRIKRLAHKRNRRREVPNAAMRGYGWGDENYRYAYSD